ncbi:MAG: hypothetical protein K940chlam3_01349 [Chlamydiae bacterium]|nr:hypothetical protein [Chlamydiota bacterium]
MKEKELLKKKKALEEENLKLRKEIVELDHLMRLAGFSNGLETVKATAHELVKYHDEEDFPEEEQAA